MVMEQSSPDVVATTLYPSPHRELEIARHEHLSGGEVLKAISNPARS